MTIPDPNDPADPRDETPEPPPTTSETAQASESSPAPEPTLVAEPTPEEARAREAVEAALALLDGAAARLSAAAGGIRFSTLQKNQGSLAYEWRQLRAQAPDIAGAQSLLAKIEPLIASLAPAQRSSAETVAAGAGPLRQALVRGMITLAPAPLHLQIEFAPDFPLAQADPLVLAARSHAVNRTALGSLRRIQWDTPDRCTLAFGDGEQRRTLVANFDAQGKLDLPPEFRQNQPRPGPKPGADAAGSRQGGPGQGRPGQARPGEGRPGQGRPGPGRRPGQQPGQQPGQRPGQPNAGPRQQNRQPRPDGSGPPKGRGDHGRGDPRGGSRGPRDGGPGGDRRGEGRDGRRDGGRGRDNRQDADPRHGSDSRRPSFPRNTAMAEKLRAALGPLAPATAPREASRAKPADRPRREGGEQSTATGPVAAPATAPALEPAMPEAPVGSPPDQAGPGVTADPPAGGESGEAAEGR